MFNFGGGTGGGGFQFGATTTSNNVSTSNTGGFQTTGGGFSFGQQSTQAPAFGGFSSFGASTAASKTLASTPQFSFGTSLQQPPQQQQPQQQQPQQQQQPTLNFSFNTPATSSTLGAALSGGSAFSFGGVTQPATTASLFGGASQPSTTASSIFAALNPTTTTTASGFSGFNLGGFNAPSQGASSGFKLTGGLNFGSQATTAAATTTASFSFGASAAPVAVATPAAAATTATGAFTLGGTQGFSFGAPQATTTTTAAPAASAIGASTNQSLAGLLGGVAKSLPSTTPATAFTLGTAPASSGFTLGGFAATTTASTPATTTTAAPSTTTTTTAPLTASTAPLGSLGGFSLPTTAASFLGGTSSSGIGATTTTATTASSAAATTTATPAATTISSTTTYAQLEEMINRWSEEMQEQEKGFLEQATQVNAWDRVLHENGEKISQLNIELEKVKLDHQRLDHDLDLILGQQVELQEVLKPLEDNVAQQAATYAQQQPQHADLERENIYKLTESLDDDLKKLSLDLKDVIEHINSTGSAADASDNVMMQVSKILNAHMDSLQWIDRNTEVLQRRVEEFSQQLTEHHQPHNTLSHLNNIYRHSPMK